jgi:hypothetical protein
LTRQGAQREFVPTFESRPPPVIRIAQVAELPVAAQLASDRVNPSGAKARWQNLEKGMTVFRRPLRNAK